MCISPLLWITYLNTTPCVEKFAMSAYVSFYTFVNGKLYDTRCLFPGETNQRKIKEAREEITNTFQHIKYEGSWQVINSQIRDELDVK